MANKALKRINKAMRERVAARKRADQNYVSPLQRALNEKDFDGFHRILEADERRQSLANASLSLMAGLLLGRRR